MTSMIYKLIDKVALSPFTYYLGTVSTIIIAAEYDTYRMHQITQDIANRYECNKPNDNINGSFIVAKNRFMCINTKFTIYKEDDANTYKKIGEEYRITMPPIFTLGNRIYYIYNDKIYEDVARKIIEPYL